MRRPRQYNYERIFVEYSGVTTMMPKSVEILFALWSLIVVKRLSASPRSQLCEEGGIAATLILQRLRS